VTKFSASTSALVFAASIVAAFIAGCGSTSSGTSGIMGTILPPPPPGAQPLSTASILGSAGFINSAGFTVYVFDADLAVPGHTACDAGTVCAQNWPPALTSAMTLPANWSTITRADNTKQLAYQGRPLYTFILDTKPGDALGDGVNAFGGLWHVARPQASIMPSPMPHPSY